MPIVAETGADAGLLTGDIGEAHDIEGQLEALDAGLCLPIASESRGWARQKLNNHGLEGGGFVSRLKARPDG